jgi:hypothetical protein
MKSAPIDPMCPENAAPETPEFKGMEDALRDACGRAMQLVFPLSTMLRLYRSVAGLTQALMQARADLGLSPRLSEELVALLDTVRDTTGMHFPDPGMPVNDAILVHRAMMALARIAHRARFGRLRGALPAQQPRPLATTDALYASFPPAPRTLRNNHKTARDQLAPEREALAGGPGFEPRMPGSEPGVLPLNYPPSPPIEGAGRRNTTAPAP